MSVQPRRRAAEETARRGDEIYEQKVRPLVEAGNLGRIAAIDVLSGSYALGETASAAARLLRAERPDAEVWLVRIGHRALHRIGWRAASSIESNVA